MSFIFKGSDYRYDAVFENHVLEKLMNLIEL